MGRPAQAAHDAGKVRHFHPGGVVFRIHGRGFGDEDGVRAVGGGDLRIALDVARIGGKVFIGAELGGVDEKADHKTLGKAAALVHERLVTGMVIAHGGHKGDVLAGRVPGAALGRQILGIGEYLHIKVW